MTRRKLGNSGLETAPLVLGGNVFGWTADEQTSFRILDAFLDAGFNTIDTADVYSKWAPGNSGGESETVIGKWLKRSGRRADAVIATKVGMEMAADKKGLRKDYIIRAVEDSLRRLQTDYIDLYQAHKDDPETPLEETLSAFNALIQQGKVRAIGASNFSSTRLTDALAVSKENGFARYETLQPLYNLFDREDYEAQLESVAERAQLGVITYYSLASGFLSGKYKSLSDVIGRPREYALTKYFNERGMAILKALDSVAADYRSTPARVAIAWLISRPTVSGAIVSATTLEQLRDITGAVDVSLDDDAVLALDQASAWRLEASA